MARGLLCVVLASSLPLHVWALEVPVRAARRELFSPRVSPLRACFTGSSTAADLRSHCRLRTTRVHLCAPTPPEFSTPPPTPPEASAPPPTPVRPHRAGFCSIVGVPNVGKSTLLNALLGERLSIATSKAQTTRHRILGIDNGDDHQIVFSDTPGVLQPQYRLQEGMMAFVRSSLNDADVLLLVVDVFQQEFPDEKLLRQLRASPAALLVLLNKVDLLDPEAAVDERRAAKATERAAKLGTVDELLKRWRDEFPGATVLPLTARRGADGGVEVVRRHVLALLPEHPPFYPKEQLTDRPERFFAAEMLREAIFEHYSQEIPCNAAQRRPSRRNRSQSRRRIRGPTPPLSPTARHVVPLARLVRVPHHVLQGGGRYHPNGGRNLRRARLAEGRSHRQGVRASLA